MKIKISQIADINAALDKINGRSTTHTATWHHVNAAAVAAEKQMESIGIPKAKRKGATYMFESGAKLPNSYKGIPNITRCIIERGSSDWYLTHAVLTAKNATASPKSELRLAKEQDKIAVAHLRKNYSITA